MNASRRWFMLSIGMGILLNPLNSSMIAVAIPRLQHVFQHNFAAVSWIIFSFYIASSIAQPVMGRVSDLFGRKKVFLAGLLVALTASLAAPLSPNLGWLILLRVVQSVGTSMTIAVGMALVRIHVTEKQGTALSVLAVFQAGAAAVGPFIGGMLVYVWDWQAIFWVNIPFVLASFLLSWRMIPKDEALDATGGSRMSLRNLASSLFPVRTFAQHPAIAWVNLQFMIVNLLFYSLFFGFPSYLQSVRLISEFHTGLIMLTLGLCSLIAAPLAGRWVDKSGPRPALLTAAVLMTFGSIWIVALGQTSPVVSVCIALAAFGISNGLTSVGMQAALFRSSPREIIGVASGLFNTSRNLGAILSLLLMNVVMGGTFSFGGFRLLGVVLTVIALGLVWMLRRRRGADSRGERSAR